MPVKNPSPDSHLDKKNSTQIQFQSLNGLRMQLKDQCRILSEWRISSSPGPIRPSSYRPDNYQHGSPNHKNQKTAILAAGAIDYLIVLPDMAVVRASGCKFFLQPAFFQ